MRPIRLLLPLLAAGLLRTAAAAVALDPETVAAAVLREHPRATAAEAALGRARAQWVSSHAGLLPKASLTSSWSRTEGVGDLSALAGVQEGDERQTHSLALTQTLFAGGRSLGAAGAGWAAWGAAKRAHDAALAQLAYDARAACVDWQAALESLEIARDAEAFALRQLEQARQQEELGAGSRIDRLFFENGLAQARIRLEGAAVAELRARGDLEALLQRPLDDGEPARSLEELVAERVGEGAPEDWPADELPALAGLRLGWSASRWSLLSSGGSVLPTLSAGLTWSNSGSDPFTYQSEHTDRLFGLTLSWPLFQGFSGAAAVASASAGLRQARAVYENGRFESRSAWSTQERALTAAARQAELAERSLAVAAENLSLLEQRRDLGLADATDLLQAELNLRSAKGSLVEARAAWLKALWAREALKGLR